MAGIKSFGEMVKRGLGIAAESAEKTASGSGANARAAGRPDSSGRAKDAKSSKSSKTSDSSRISENHKETESSKASFWSRISAAPVNKLQKRNKPQASDFFKNKGEDTTSSTPLTSTTPPSSGPAVTPVPLDTSDQDVEDLGARLQRFHTEDEAKSNAERFEPVSSQSSTKPKSSAERFEPVSVPSTTSPTTSPPPPTNGNQATCNQPVSFGTQFRERPSGNDFDDEDEDEKEEKDEYEEEDDQPATQRQQSHFDQVLDSLAFEFRGPSADLDGGRETLGDFWNRACDEQEEEDRRREAAEAAARAEAASEIKEEPEPEPEPEPAEQPIQQPAVQRAEDFESGIYNFETDVYDDFESGLPDQEEDDDFFDSDEFFNADLPEWESDDDLPDCEEDEQLPDYEEEEDQAAVTQPPVQEAEDVELELEDREEETPVVVQPAAQVAIDVEVEITGDQHEEEKKNKRREVVRGGFIVDSDDEDVEMTSAGNPFGGVPFSGAPSSSAPMFGGSSIPSSTSSPFAQPQPQLQPSQQSAPAPSMTTAFGTSPFGTASSSPFGNPSAAAPSTTTSAFGATPFGHLSKAVSNTLSPVSAPSFPTTWNQQRQPSPFGAPSDPTILNLIPTSGPIANPFGSSPIANPFAPSKTPSQQPQQPPASSSQPPARGGSALGVFAKALSDGAEIGVSKPNPFESLKNIAAAPSQQKPNQQSGATKPNPFDAFKSEQSQPSPAAAPLPAFGGAPTKKAVHFAETVQTNDFTPSASPALKMGNGQHDRFAPQPSEGTAKLSSLAVDYAKKVNGRLRSDGIAAPRWPSSDPGNPSQRPAMEKLKEQYKKYRARAYDSLRKAEIIDDPDRKRRLEDALTFKGICEDMCPDYEQVTRICEYDVKKEEKRPSPSGGDPWADPAKMVKKFARSAAGIEEPLPMDVRSVDALKRSTDYLLGDLLKTDSQLPSLHGYLWDRTRAVRKDFSFHSQKSSEEMQVMVYILETIARFHVVSLHLLSRKGFASDDFDQKQEVEQLGATLLSLKEAYDDCRQRNLLCENEGEFRALYLVLNMHSPYVIEECLEWASQPWNDSTHMENARSLLAALQSFDQPTGPFRPHALGTHFASSSFTRFFDLVGSKTVSYTLACMCEVHFVWVRQRILATMIKAFARRRDWPKDITPRVLNRMLRFDTDEEAVEFAKLHDFEFDTRQVDGHKEQFLLLKSKQQHVPSPRVPQSHSATLVEAKRNGRPLTEVFRRPIYGEKDIEFDDGESERSHILPDNTADQVDSDDGDDMFVGQSSQKTVQPTNGVNGKQPEAKQSTSPFGAPTASPFAAKPSPFGGNGISFGAPSIAQSAADNAPPAAKPSPFAPASSNATFNAFQPSNGISQNGTSTTPAAQPFKPAASPFMQGSGKPAINPFASPAPAAQQPASNNAASTPASAPAKAPETSASSFFGTAQKQTPAVPPDGSVFAEPNKTPAPFQGFGPGSSQTSTPTAATPSTGNKDTSTTGAKTSTPASVFSSLTSEKITPSSSSFFSTNTPAAPTSSEKAQPAAPSKTPAPSIFSTVGSADISKPTPAAPSTTSSSVFSQPAVAKATTTTPTSQQKQAQTQPSSTSQYVAPPAKPTAAAPSSVPQNMAPPQQQPSDPMADFTKWFVSGDKGLLEEFTEYTVEGILADTFAQFKRDEAERIAREEDEASWAAAREHMAYRLSVKFFYRWRNTARELAMQRKLRDGRAKYKAVMEAQEKAKREKRIAEKKAAERKKRDEIRAREERLRNSADELVGIIQETQRSRQSSTEDALLATGIFAGVRGNEREVARRVVKEAHLPRRPTSSQSSITMPPPVSKQPPVKEGWKTRSIREKLGLGRRRESFGSSSPNYTNHNGVSNFSRSLPVGAGGGNKKPAKVTNFSASTSRKRSAEASDDEPDPKKNKILTSGYSVHWELRRRGLVQMPDGQWLPEIIAKQMYEGKRFDGYGNCGLGPGKPSAVMTPSPPPSAENKKHAPVAHKNKDLARTEAAANSATPSSTQRQSKLDALAAKFGFPPTKRYNRRDSNASGTSSNLRYRPALSKPRTSTSSPPINSSGNGGGKRKRDTDDQDAEGSPDSKKARDLEWLGGDEQTGGEEDEAGLTSKEKTERALARMKRQIAELNESMDLLDSEERPWMREQIARMGGLGGQVRDEGDR